MDGIEDRIVESWRNGQWGALGDERIRLHVHTINGIEYWSVEHRSARIHDAYPCDNEAQAHDTVRMLTEQRPGNWSRVDPEALGYRG